MKTVEDIIDKIYEENKDFFKSRTDVDRSIRGWLYYLAYKDSIVYTFWSVRFGKNKKTLQGFYYRRNLLQRKKKIFKNVLKRAYKKRKYNIISPNSEKINTSVLIDKLLNDK